MDEEHLTNRREPQQTDLFAREGAYDAQLSFDAPIIEAPQPFKKIFKRDGTTAPFDKAKIARAIHRAALSAGEDDMGRAESLASAVALYMTKRGNGFPPNVEQVNDAVERVLMELGHGEVALAYARYRDKRARVRELRTGNLRVVLRELEEARQANAEGRTAEVPSLFVRTSDEALVAWDSERIVEALVRETRIDRDQAQVIALEVEHQIASANVKTLTASLVRELVDAKLLEHGLEKYRRRHMRLGVPLYDAESVICLPNQEEQAAGHDPRATDLELAARVKKEFALTQVFGQEEADAHLRGGLHLHGLGFVDRLHSCRPSLAYIAQCGMPGSGSRRFGRPPRRAEDLLPQVNQFSASLHNHFVGEISWQILNVLLAPYVADLKEDSLRQFVRLLLIGLSGRRDAMPQGRVAVELAWHMPEDLAQTPVPGQSKTYGDYEDAAQQVTLAILDEVREDSSHYRRAGLRLRAIVGDRTFEAPRHEEFLARLGEHGARGHGLRTAFLRGEGAAVSAGLQDVSLAEVVLNLPRLAYGEGGEDELHAAIRGLVEVAARAHAAKREFVEKLLSVRSFGPLSFLTAEQDSTPLFSLDKARYRVALAGLNECVRALAGKEMHESAGAAALAERLLACASEACAHYGQEAGIALQLCAGVDEEARRRFAAMDLRLFPEQARAVMSTDSITQDFYYTSGVRVPAEAALTPIERVRLEGRLHQHLAAPASTCIRVPDSETAPRSVADFIKKAFQHSTNSELIFKEQD